MSRPQAEVKETQSCKRRQSVSLRHTTTFNKVLLISTEKGGKTHEGGNYKLKQVESISSIALHVLFLFFVVCFSYYITVLLQLQTSIGPGQQSQSRVKIEPVMSLKLKR